MANVAFPYSIVCKTSGEIIISECGDNKVSIFGTEGVKKIDFGHWGDSPGQMRYPRGVAIDEHENIYISSQHKLQKFTKNGFLIKCVGTKGRGERELYYPRGVTIYKSQIYVCDSANNRIQVVDLDLQFVQSIGLSGDPYDIKFDSVGNMYIAEFKSKRIEILDTHGLRKSVFGNEGETKLDGPTGLHIADNYVYVGDHRADCIAVYNTAGDLITKFGKRGKKLGQLYGTYGIAIHDGHIYICDSWNQRVQVFTVETVLN
jgi:DNA-binding beta-propeller fold protein YncE